PLGTFGSGTSNMAWCRLGSNFSPCGSNRLMPCFSITFMSSRSVSSTPSMCDLTTGSAWSRKSAESVSSARCMLSATASRSRAKLATAYCRVSAISRSVRRRRFSISASVRSSRSLVSAASLASAAGSGAGAAWAAASAVACGSVEWPFGSVIVLASVLRIGSIRPGISRFATEKSSGSTRWRVCPCRQTGDHFAGTRAGGSAAQEFAHHPGGVVDHRDHPRVVEPGRADHADDADDAAGGVVVGRDHGRRTGQRKQLVLRADEDAHALGLLGATEQVGHPALGLEVVEQQAHALEVLQRLEVVEQVGVAAHDQPALRALAARPAGEPGRHDLLGGHVELVAPGLEP